MHGVRRKIATHSSRRAYPLVDRNENQTEAMEKRIIPQLKSGLCAALSMLSCMAFAATPPSSPPGPAADEAVILTGWLHVEDYSMAGVLVTVEVNGEVHTSTVTTESGRFDLVLPADVEAVLRFEKPGHLPKEVTVDTRHSRDGEAGRKIRHVKFAVILELERLMGGLTYAGPVGSIGFDPDGGCLAVEHDRELVRVKRKSIMKF